MAVWHSVGAEHVRAKVLRILGGTVFLLLVRITLDNQPSDYPRRVTFAPLAGGGCEESFPE
jgi:hypothetical protein